MPNINKTTVSSVVTPIAGYAKTAKLVKKTLGRNSITRMAKDSVLQFPMIMSSGIQTEDAITIARAFERQYASMMVSVFSMNPSIDLDHYDSISQYIKKFHNNDSIPSDITAATSSVTESVSLVDATFIDSDNIPELRDVAMACWGPSTESLNTTILNNTYQPYMETYRKLQMSLHDIHAATEGKVQDAIDKATSTGNALNDMNNHQNDEFGGLNPQRKTRDTTIGQTPELKNFASVVKNDKLLALEPTLINVPFVVHQTSGGNNTQFTQNVVLGCKAMIRSITPDMMTANMAEAVRNSNSIFKFMKWAKGELGLVKDWIFDISQIKDSALAEANGSSSRFFYALKRRAQVNSVTKFLNNPLLPSTTIIITAFEAAKIKDLTGIDLYQEYNAMKLISKYYILGFAIYDTEQKTLSVLFDGESEYSQASIDYVAAGNKRDVNLADTKDMLKLMGRI